MEPYVFIIYFDFDFDFRYGIPFVIETATLSQENK